MFVYASTIITQNVMALMCSVNIVNLLDFPSFSSLPQTFGEPCHAASPSPEPDAFFPVAAARNSYSQSPGISYGNNDTGDNATLPSPDHDSLDV